MSVNRTDSKRVNTSATTNDDGELINRNDRTRAEDGFQRNFSNRFNIIKKLDTVGKFVSFSFSNNNTENNSTSHLNSLREIFGDNPEEQLLDQRSEVNNKSGDRKMPKYGLPLKIRREM